MSIQPIKGLSDLINKFLEVACFFLSLQRFFLKKQISKISRFLQRKDVPNPLKKVNKEHKYP